MARKQRGETRERIIEAAERMFARHGIQGASVRDIFKEAGVGTGLMTYYFESKEDLFSVTVERRIPEVRAEFDKVCVQHGIDEAESAREILRFYLWFFLRHLPREGGNLADYWNLLSKSAVSYENRIVGENFARFDFIAERIIAALSRSLPGVPTDKLRNAISFAEAGVTTLNASKGLFEHRMDQEIGGKPAGSGDDLDSYIESVAAILAAGLENGG